MTGLPIETINERVANGEVITEDGTLAWPTDATVVTEETAEDTNFPYQLIGILVCAVIAISIAIALNMKKKRQPAPSEGIKQDKGRAERKLLENGKEKDR